MGLLYAGIAASLIAIPIGWICFRLRGPYFSLSILAFSEVLRLIVLHWKEVTEGAVGILLINSIVAALQPVSAASSAERSACCRNPARPARNVGRCSASRQIQAP